MSRGTTCSPFRLSGKLYQGRFRRLGTLVENTVERLLDLHRLDRWYQQMPPSGNVDEFLGQVLDVFGIEYEVMGIPLDDIPASGGAIMLCNHPFGALEGIILAQLMLRVRPDIRVMANGHLDRIPELRELLIAVDPFGGAGAARRNLAPLRAALRWVRAGGLLVIFPAGEVSHINLKAGGITDPEWSPSIGRLIRMAAVPVIPAFVAGANSRLFQLAGLLHPRLRTALLARELTNKRNCTINITLGEPVAIGDLRSRESDVELINYLRFRTYLLREAPRYRGTDEGIKPARSAPQVPVEAGRPAGEIAREIALLPAPQRLLQQGSVEVYWAQAPQMGAILQEIGRLRELTFRAVGEGTGRPLDLDRFDDYYLHLFAWDTDSRQIIGAYRLGLVDRILDRHGRRGLYTYTLFDYPPAFLRRIEPAVELGRSFVRQEWQRNYTSLLLLWKGIGRFIARHPRYRVLFGPVSISDDYHALSLKLMVEFLRENNFPRELAREVKPRRRLRADGGRTHRDPELPRLSSFDSLCDMVSLIEGNERSVPVLLKQYLKLGGNVVGFNSDSKFGDCVDALLMVDLPATSPRVLSRYMGKEEAASYLAAQSLPAYREAG